MDDVVSFSVQQMLNTVVTLPTDEEMKYWDLHFREISKEVRSKHMDNAENELRVLKLNPEFIEIFNRLPIDLQSCVSIMMAAKEDLDVITAKNSVVMIA